MIVMFIKYGTYLYGSVFAFTMFIALLIMNKFELAFCKYDCFRLRLDSINVGKVSFVGFLVTFLISLIYLFYPNYLDHVESTIAHLGAVLHRGGTLWPNINTDYTFRGLLYGPALAEIQLIPIAFKLPVIEGSKLTGVIAFLVSYIAIFIALKSQLARGYLIYMLPFGLFLYWDRADPLLVMSVSLSILLGVKKPNNILLALVLGVFGAFCAALKLHTILYIIGVYCVIDSRPNLIAVMAFAVSAIASFLAFFKFDIAELTSFLSYLSLASKHGLSAQMLLQNFFFVFFMFLPIIIVILKSKPTHRNFNHIFLLLILELVLAVVGAKPGAGIHHLLPMIPVNALMMSRLDNQFTIVPIEIKLLYLCIVLPSILIAINIIKPIMANWERQKAASTELSDIAIKYPGVVMGESDNPGYPLTFYRVLLNNINQIDPASYMDLQYSGVGDTNLVQAMNTCKIKEFVIPRSGLPFSMYSYYPSGTLFTDRLREIFNLKYKEILSGKFFNVYSCRWN